MFDPKKIEKLARQIHEALPTGVRELGNDMEKKIRQILQAQLNRLNLVSREEFDVQTQVLLRLRENVTALEQRVSALEKTAANRPTPPTETAPESNEIP